jgi:very-short-patch-repair endonuclease
MRRNPSQPPLVRGGENAKLFDIDFIPYNKVLVSRARELRSNQTFAEKIFWKALINRKTINYKFTRQKPVDNFIVDFYCSKLLLAVEIDGRIHLVSEVRDQERTDILNCKYGILVVRYSNDDVLNNSKKIIDNLEKIIQSRKFFLFPLTRGIKGVFLN